MYGKETFCVENFSLVISKNMTSDIAIELEQL